MENNLERKIIYYLLQPLWSLFASFINSIWKISDNISRKIIFLQEKFDPIPNPKKGETYDQWLNRIDLKYALRYANFTQLCYFHIDEKEMAEKIKMQKNKADKKLFKDIYKLLILHNVRSQEHYRIVMARKEVEERMKETQRG